jgi:hypothetical protein
MPSKVRTRVFLPFIALSMIAGLTACEATKQVSMKTAPDPGFLPNPALLQKGGSLTIHQFFC